jgi:alpha-D-xyloside xylohydrolase
MDEVISGLREATGRAPLWPRWALGYWQSKERYASQDELMGVAREYRRRGIPIDNIVLDWQYWGRLGWNAMGFDRSAFPDPVGMIDSLHTRYNLHLMISIWPQVDSATALYRDLYRKGHL